MLPYINFLNIKIPSYFIMCLLGVLLGLFSALKIGKKYKIKKEDIIYCFIYQILGMVIGAKLLYILENIQYDYKTFLENRGVSFCGGILGGTLALYIYSRQYNISFYKLSSVLTIVFPIFYTFAKIGCFCAGCCYGIEYSGVGNIISLNSKYSPKGEMLFPIQLIESFYSFIISIIMLVTIIKEHSIKKYTPLAIFLLIFGFFRFFSDFFRGELKEKNTIISPTQIICCMLIVISILEMKINDKNKISNNP